MTYSAADRAPDEMAPQRLAVVSRHVRAGNVTVVAAAATAATAAAATYQPPPAERQPLEPPARLSSVTGGHVHPSLCVTTQGDTLAVWNRGDLMTDAQELLLSRSSDGGRTWSDPDAIPSTQQRSAAGSYPGALAVLRSGVVVLHWAPFSGTFADGATCTPEYCVSTDGGHTFGPVVRIEIPDPTYWTCLRHAPVEDDDGSWILPLYDRTVRYDPRTHAVSAFGDGRNHGMVPLVRTPTGALVSGAPQHNSPVPCGAENAFGSHYVKMIHLPRQARDKHNRKG
jgi:hypothetical protein